MASAWFGGFGKGILSVISSALIAWFVFIPTHYSFSFTNTSEPILLMTFVTTGIFCVLLAENLHRARRRLIESESRERDERARLRVTLASIGDAVIATDMNGKITFLNGVAEELTGWKQTEAFGQDLSIVFRIVNEFTREEVENPIVKVLREGVTVGLANHTALIARNGDEHPIADSGAPIKDDNGKIIGAVLVFRDITEGRDAEAATLQLAAIVASSDDGIISKTLDGVITSWNHSAEAMFGYSPAEAIGKPIHIIIPPSLRVEEDRILERLRKGERIEHYETVRHRKDGTPIDVSLTVSPVKNSAGRVIGASKIIRDVTEQKRQEQALRESEAYFRSLGDAMPQLVWIARTDGVIEYYNSRSRLYDGISLNHDGTWEWQPIVHEDDLQMTLDTWGRPYRPASFSNANIRSASRMVLSAGTSVARRH